VDILIGARVIFNHSVFEIILSTGLFVLNAICDRSQTGAGVDF